MNMNGSRMIACHLMLECLYRGCHCQWLCCVMWQADWEYCAGGGECVWHQGPPGLQVPSRPRCRQSWWIQGMFDHASASFSQIFIFITAGTNKFTNPQNAFADNLHKRVWRSHCHLCNALGTCVSASHFCVSAAVSSVLLKWNYGIAFLLCVCGK